MFFHEDVQLLHVHALLEHFQGDAVLRPEPEGLLWRHSLWKLAAPLFDQLGEVAFLPFHDPDDVWLADDQELTDDVAVGDGGPRNAGDDEAVILGVADRAGRW